MRALDARRQYLLKFRSQSSADKVYETVVWKDGRLSCNCPGWTRRTQPDGSRMCVHTRVILSGIPEKDPLFISCEPPLNREITAKPLQPPKPQPEPAKSTGRKFNFDA